MGACRRGWGTPDIGPSLESWKIFTVERKKGTSI
jgi:hypothetical protein